MHFTLNAAKTVVTRLAGRATLQISNHLPEILTGLGIVGGAATVFTAVRSTMELEENTKEGRRLIDGHKKLRKERSEEVYSSRQYAKDMAISYVRYAQGFVKTYAIPMTLGVASAAAVLGAVGILNRRNAAISAAYNLLDAAYRSYKKKVVAELGEEREAQLSGWTQAPACATETVETDETAKTEDKDALAKKFRDRCSDGKPSPYAVWFSPSNANWDASPDDRLFFLKCVQNYMNDKLNAKGHLFTNDVYRALGMPDTKSGSVTGWIKGGNHGDGFVDLGLEKIEANLNSAFGNTMTKGFWIELNVDGVIFDLLKN